MSSTDRFVIVVGIDFSELADSALDQALEMACLRDGSEVHVLYVEPDAWVGATLTGAIERATNADTAVHQVQQRTTERVEKMPAHLEQRRIRRVVAHFRRGSPAEEVAQFAADLDADQVVVGSHGHRGLARLFLGSVAERVARLARCPVWIVRPKDHSTAGRVPEIEPPCPDCTTARFESHGEKFWCDRHSEHHIRPHRYSYVTRGIYSADTEAFEATPERGA